VLYLAETPEHALAEVLRWYQGKPLRRGHLRARDRRTPGTFHNRAIVEAFIPETVNQALPDLGEGAILKELGIRADALPSSDRSVTKAISQKIYGKGYLGFRWWSALKGDWHATILFLDRVDPSAIRYSTPEELSIDHPLVHTVARYLKMPLRKR
jgi:hypothetical protein